MRDTDSIPTTRAEAREAVEFTTELVASPPPDFLPLPVRRVLYVLGLAGAVAAPVLAVSSPEYAAAIVTASGIISAAAIGTALANPTRCAYGSVEWVGSSIASSGGAPGIQ